MIKVNANVRPVFSDFQTPCKGLVNNMDHLPILGFTYASEMNEYRKANLTLEPIKCRGSKVLDMADISCTTLKRAGHFKSGIYTLKGPNDLQPRLSFCNMEVNLHTIRNLHF